MNISIPKIQIFPVPLPLKLYSHQGGVQTTNTSFILFGGIEEDSLSIVSYQTYHFDIASN